MCKGRCGCYASTLSRPSPALPFVLKGTWMFGLSSGSEFKCAGDWSCLSWQPDAAVGHTTCICNNICKHVASSIFVLVGVMMVCSSVVRAASSVSVKPCIVLKQDDACGSYGYSRLPSCSRIVQFKRALIVGGRRLAYGRCLVAWVPSAGYECVKYTSAFNTQGLKLPRRPGCDTF